MAFASGFCKSTVVSKYVKPTHLDCRHIESNLCVDESQTEALVDAMLPAFEGRRTDLSQVRNDPSNPYFQAAQKVVGSVPSVNHGESYSDSDIVGSIPSRYASEEDLQNLADKSYTNKSD